MSVPADPTESFPLDSASVLLAGATGGLGRALGAELARRGAVLTLVARSADRLAALGLPGVIAALDLRSPDSCATAVGVAAEHGGRLDIVVNAVGVVAFGAVDDLSVDTMEDCSSPTPSCRSCSLARRSPHCRRVGRS